MKYRFNKNSSRDRSGGFTLIEVAVSLSILAVICSAILVIFDRSMEAYAQNREKIDAFNIARENMEKLWASQSVSQMLLYGRSDKNPNIEWETRVEPVIYGTQAWCQATCSATYNDSNDQPSKIEIVSLLTEIPLDIAEKLRQSQNDPNQPGYDANYPGNFPGSETSPESEAQGDKRLQDFLRSVQNENK